MNIYQLTDTLIQFCLNTALAFFIISLSCRIITKLIPKTSRRMISFLKIVPFLRLALEPLLYICPINLLPLNLSLFSCSHPIQYMLYKSLPLEIRDDMAIYGIKTVIGAAIIQIPGTILAFIVSMLVLSTALSLLSFFIQMGRSYKKQKQIENASTPFELNHLNESLKQQLLHKGAKVYRTNKPIIPHVSINRSILLPENVIHSLSNEELQSVIAHELEHIRWHDTHIRFAGGLIQTIFWWLPLSKKIEEIVDEQEIACDEKVPDYSIKPINLAKALQKVARLNQINYQAPYLVSQLTKDTNIITRIKLMLSYDKKRVFNRKLYGASIALLLSLVFLIHFAIC